MKELKLSTGAEALEKVLPGFPHLELLEYYGSYSEDCWAAIATYARCLVSSCIVIPDEAHSSLEQLLAGLLATTRTCVDCTHCHLI